MKLLILSAILLGAGLTISAYARHGDCVQDHLISLGAPRPVDVGACKVQEELGLSTRTIYYRHMNSNPYLVKYWRGSFSKTVRYASEYLHEVVDECWNRIILSQKEVYYSERDFSFAIQNPNLSQEVNASYQLVPLTDAEASAAFAAIKTECERFVP